MIVTRTEGHNHDAIRLVSHSAGPLTLMIHPGVVLSTGGETAHGIEVHANPTSTSDINIVSAADITYMSPAATGASGGIIGRISNAASTVSMTITQKAGSSITTNGIEAIRIYSLAYGNNASRIEVGGTIKTQRHYSEGAFAYSALTSSTSKAEVHFTDTARVTTRGEESSGAWVFHSGLGATTATTAGAIETFGSGGAYGIFTRSISTANTAQHRVELNGSGTLVTHGDDGVGIRMAHAGSGMVDAEWAAQAELRRPGTLLTASGWNLRSGRFP